MEDRLITRDDLIAGGLCLEGVNEVISRLWPVPEAMPLSQILPKLAEEEVEQVNGALKINGYGDGDGNGYGYGYGDGNGYGYGDGYGYGYGDGNGYGYGYGYGYGDGYGYGNGDGTVSTRSRRKS